MSSYPQQATSSAVPAKGTGALRKLALAAVALGVAFLAGFVPGYTNGARLESELRVLRQESGRARLRDLAALAYLQANQKDYGLASGTTGRLFTQLREVAGETTDPTRKQALESLLPLRDGIIAKLATGDPAVVADLQSLFVRTREATEAYQTS
jgi:hypothetical protein